MGTKPRRHLDAIKRLATHFALPKSELMSFDGDPLEYFLFISSFENSVEKDTDDKRRLQLLIQYCGGKASQVKSSLFTITLLLKCFTLHGNKIRKIQYNKTITGRALSLF